MRLSGERKTDLLHSIPLFGGCSREELEAVARVTDELTLPAGRVLMQEGAAGRELIVLVDGEVQVERGGEAIGAMSGGDFIGELALVLHRPRTATVTATTEVRILALEARQFERLLEDVPTIATKVLKAVAERLPPEDL